MTPRHDALRDLLTAFLADITEVTFMYRGDLIESGPWRSLRSVWVTRDAVSFWHDEVLHVEARATELPSDLADLVRLVVLEASRHYADVVLIRERMVGPADDPRLALEFLRAAPHLDWCEYRNGHYDELVRCDCGLVQTRRLLRTR